MFFPTDAGDRLLANLHSGTPSLCAYVFSHPNLVEVAGLAGIDCFMADMMFTALDWEQIAQLIRAARGTGISPMIRVQTYPWSDGIDQRTVSDAARALALGATAVTISIASCAQMQALLRLRSDWHRLIHIPSDLVVDHRTSSVESSLPLDFLSLHAMWTPFGGLMSCKIMSIISVCCDFTTKSGGIWKLLLEIAREIGLTPAGYLL